jgi:hypothetical protein
MTERDSMTVLDSVTVLDSLTERDCRERSKTGGDGGTGVYMREGTTSRAMAADRPYGEFYGVYSVGPEYFGYTVECHFGNNEKGIGRVSDLDSGSLGPTAPLDVSRSHTAGRTPLDKGSDRRRNRYLTTQHSQQTNHYLTTHNTTHNTHNKSSV